jgi:hypothetical protein
VPSSQSFVFSSFAAVALSQRFAENFGIAVNSDLLQA